MSKVKTNELIGPALDWAVAKCEGQIYGLVGTRYEFQPSTHWAHGGPIIEKEKIDIDFYKNDCEASLCNDCFTVASGPTPLISAMRCYVISKLGAEVEVPDGLLC